MLLPYIDLFVKLTLVAAVWLIREDLNAIKKKL
jgi:hypothetical protein